MKRTRSDLATCAETISQKKFIKLSPQKQHALLAAMAMETMETMVYDRFYKRYDLLHSWADLDRYHPPSWLTDREAVYESYLFHDSYTPHVLERDEKDRLDNPEIRVSWEPKHDVTVVLDQVRSPYNVGAVIRIIDNFGLKALVHCTSGLDLSHPQLKKAARGCEKWIPIRFEEDLISWLKTVGAPIIGIEKTSEALPLSEWHPPDRCVLILGNEAYGIAESVRGYCDTIIQIPMSGYKNSMNVHHALSIVAYRISERVELEDMNRSIIRD